MVKISNIISINESDQKLSDRFHVNFNQEDSTLSKCDYKSYIQPNLLRRMAPIVRKGVASAQEIYSLDEKDFGAIIVATGMGCLKDSIKFIEQYRNNQEGLISPTAFIQSTHNTIAGQIGLLQKNHAYNMTYSQNGFSFESALLDAICQVNEDQYVLLGASEEYQPILDEFAALFGLETKDLTGGATFMGLSRDCGDVTLYFEGIFPVSNINSLSEIQNIKETDLILYGRSDLLHGELDQDERIDFRYDSWAGRYLTNSAYGVHLAADIIKFGNHLTERTDFTDVVVMNNYQNSKVAITRLSKG